MSEFPPNDTLSGALRSLPVPVLSSDFDDRILAALRVPVPWWRRLWQPVQPLLLGASGSCVLTLLLLHWALSIPQTVPLPSPAALPNIAAVSAPLPSVDALLDRPGLCAGSLAAWNSSPDAVPEPRRPEPRRRAEVSRRETLVV